MQRGSILTSYQSIMEALDSDPTLANLASAAHLNAADMYTDTRLQELQKYPHTDRMIDALRSAGLLEKKQQQVLFDLLFACKTIRLRSEHKSSRNSTLMDEHAELADFMECMAARKLLTAKLCHAVFGDISWQQKLRKLRAALNALEPLNDYKINALLEDVLGYLDLQEKMDRIDKAKQCFSFLFDQVKREDHAVIRNCLQACTQNGYDEWLSTDRLMKGLREPGFIHETFKGYHLLHKVDMLDSHADEMSADNDYNVSLQILSDAEILTQKNALLALTNKSFVSVVQSLQNANLLGLYGSKCGPRKNREVTCFNSKDSRTILESLLRQPKDCENLALYSTALTEHCDQTDSDYFTLHRNIMLKLLYEIHPKNTGFVGKSLPNVTETALHENTFTQIREALQESEMAIRFKRN